MGEKRNTYRLLVGKPEGKRPLGSPRRRWMDNIRLDLGEVGCGDVDWIGLQSSYEFDFEPLGSINAGKLLSGLTTAGLLSSAQLLTVR
jgi:hypothetical protein